jgi:hypothetical protein
MVPETLVSETSVLETLVPEMLVSETLVIDAGVKKQAGALWGFPPQRGKRKSRRL